MAILSTTDRERVWRGLMRYYSRKATPMPFTKVEFMTAVANTDQWQDDNAASFNTALNAVVRNGLDATAKAELFCAVALMRTGNVALLKAILGEVD